MNSSMWRLAVVALAVGTLTACSARLGQPDDGAVVSQWRLVADDSGGLNDMRNPDLAAYPNAGAVQWLDISVWESGRVCASDGDSTWCGGPAHGIPYTVRGQVRGESLCMRVMDLYGRMVSEHCGLSHFEQPNATTEARCHTATTSAGAPCELCTDETGRITSNTCAENGEFAEPGTTPAPEGTTTPPETMQDTCLDPDVAMNLGVELFINELNDAFTRMGLDATMPAPEAGQLVTYDEGDISLGDPSCADILDHLDDSYSDDHPGTNDYVFGDYAIERCQNDGRCKLGQVVTRSMAEACAQIPAGCNLDQVSRGIIGSGGYAVTSACPGDEQLAAFDTVVDDCIGSPLVLDVDGDGLSLVGPSEGVSFPLYGGSPVSTGWLAGDGDALLAQDLDGDGAITGGAELFGEATDGGAPDGFAALARRDTDGDGFVRGAELDGLLAWVDDGDAQSEPGELFDISTVGITSIPVASQPVAMCDASGNDLSTPAAATLVDGGTMSVVDVWFSIGN